jgi:hypothetical protein
MTTTLEQPPGTVPPNLEQSPQNRRTHDVYSARKENGGFRPMPAILLVAVNIALLAAGVASTFWFFGANIGVAGLAVALPATSLCTFIVLFTDHRDIRTAVMGSFTVLYLGFVSATFNHDFVGMMSDRDGFGRHVYDSFNTFMLVMLGFYFSGKAVEKVISGRAKMPPAPPKDRGPAGTVEARAEASPR